MGSLRCPPTSQLRAGGLCEPEAHRDPWVCALVLRGRLRPKQPLVSEAWVESPQDVSIYCSRGGGGGGGGKDEDGEVAIGEEGGKQ